MKLSFKGNPYFYQCFATISGTFAVIACGIHLGWTSPYLPKILAGNSQGIHATSDEGSWCAVMPLMGAPFGAFLTAGLVDRIGRKPSVLLWASIAIASFLTIAFARTIFVISAARFFGGSVEGALYTALPMYIAEISHPNMRGKLSALVSISAKLGTLLINTIGPVLPIKTSSFICATIPVLHFLTFMWMPESPYYLLKKGRRAEAECNLKILRGGYDVSQEFSEISEAVRRQDAMKSVRISDLFSVPSNRAAVFIFVTLALTNKFSGKNPFLFYTSTIFSFTETNISTDLAVAIYCSVEILSTLLALVLIDKFGRRPLMILSAFGCSLALASEGVYFYLMENHFDVVQNFHWWPVAALISYNVIFSLGLAFGPVLLLSELFPINIKSVALSCGDTFSMIMGVITSKFFQITKDRYGMHVPFFSFSVCCLTLLPVIVAILPETKGKSLENIQLLLENQNQRHRHSDGNLSNN